MNQEPTQPGDTLERFGHKKEIPDLLREEILLSLSYYPELLDVCIKFVLISPMIKKSVMQAQPEFRSYFTPGKKRHYVIRISRYFKGGPDVLPIETLPRRVLIGWIGHELGHVMDYEERDFWQMARFGFGYLFSNKYLMQAERTADSFAISHGLGKKIMATKNFILDHAYLPERYKRKIRRLYLSPEDALKLIEEYEAKHPEIVKEIEKTGGVS
jgi:hypothetical protein